MTEIDALIAQKAQEISAGFIRESTEKLRRLAERFGDARPVAPKCNAPWVSTVLEVDGTLRPCFFHSTVASTTNATLAEALNSPRALEFRAALDIPSNPTCQRCVCSLNYRKD